MSLFNTILEKLGLAKPEPKPTPVVTTQKDSRPVPQQFSTPKPVETPKPTTQAPGFQVYTDSAHIPDAFKAAQQPKPMAMVDVMSKLQKMATDKGEKLDWKASIVDLLKVLGMDSSLAARKELAVELGCPPEKMKESINMNIWLHKTVLEKIAEHGGNIPPELLLK